MSTFNEIAYLIYDKLGISSDDSKIEIDHILFMMKNYRTYLLKQQYTDAKRLIPQTNYQNIHLDIEQITDCIVDNKVKSVQKVPSLINLNGSEAVIITPQEDLFNSLEWTFITEQRFKVVGFNKWLSRIIYFTVGSDEYLYLKSINPDFKYLKKIMVSALFDDPIKAAELSSEGQDCDVLNTPFPLEEPLIPVLIDLIVEKLTPVVYKPEVESNNASDDLAGLGTTK